MPPVGVAPRAARVIGSRRAGSSWPLAAVPPAGRSLRVLARLVDVALQAAVVALVYTELLPRLVAVAPGRRNLVDALRTGDMAALLTLLAVGLILEVVPTALAGCTPGKLVMGLRVRSLGGGRPGVVPALARWLPVAAVSVVPVAAPLLVPVWGWSLGPRRTGLHDRLAGTLVVDATPA